MADRYVIQSSDSSFFSISARLSQLKFVGDVTLTSYPPTRCVAMVRSSCSPSQVWIVWKPSWHRHRRILVFEPVTGSLLTTVHSLTCEPWFRESPFIVYCTQLLSPSLPLLPFPSPSLSPPPSLSPSYSRTPSIALGLIVVLIAIQLIYTFFQRTGAIGQTGRAPSSFNPFVSNSS